MTAFLSPGLPFFFFNCVHWPLIEFVVLFAESLFIPKKAWPSRGIPRGCSSRYNPAILFGEPHGSVASHQLVLSYEILLRLPVTLPRGAWRIKNREVCVRHFKYVLLSLKYHTDDSYREAYGT